MDEDLQVGLYGPPLGQLGQISQLDILLKIRDGKICAVVRIFIGYEAAEAGPDVSAGSRNAEEITGPAGNQPVEGDAAVAVIIKDASISQGTSSP